MLSLSRRIRCAEQIAGTDLERQTSRGGLRMEADDEVLVRACRMELDPCRLPDSLSETIGKARLAGSGRAPQDQEASFPKKRKHILFVDPREELAGDRCLALLPPLLGIACGRRFVIVEEMVEQVLDDLGILGSLH